MAKNYDSTTKNSKNYEGTSSKYSSEAEQTSPLTTLTTANQTVITAKTVIK